jgi:hypothetical protein
MNVDIKLNMRLREVIYMLVVLLLLLVMTRADLHPISSILASLGILSVLGLLVAWWGGLPNPPK